MYQSCHMDIAAESAWRLNAPFETGNPPPFWVGEAGFFHAGKAYFTCRQDKDDHLFLHTLDCAGSLFYQNEQYALDAGSTVFFNCRQYHEYCTDPVVGRWRFYWMHVSGPGCAFMQDALYPDRFEPRYRPEDAVRDAIGAIMDLMEAPCVASWCKISDIAGHLLAGLMRESRRAGGDEATKKDAVQAAVSYIRENYRSGISLEDMAQHCHLSKYYFLRQFKKQMRITPHQFLVHTRVNAARKLLRTSGHKIATVGEMAGFTDECHFSRTFRAVTGQTPQQYRREG